ncbi:MAG: ABC transporter ATP-binding protein/permease [Bacteroidales bacterium]|nr:ABC transporter ATP-binding protein/permease [Bacteroidales bacterium]
MKDWGVVFKYITKYKGWIALHILFALLSVAGSVFTFGMAIPFLRVLFGMQEIVTELQPFSLSPSVLLNNLNYFIGIVIVSNGKATALAMIVGIVIIFSLIRNLFHYISLSCLAPIRSYTPRDIRNNLYKKIVSLPLAYFSKERKGDLMSRITSDISEIESSILNSLDAIFCSPIEVIVFLTVLMYISPPLTLMALAVLPISVLILGLVSSKLKRQAKGIQEKMGQMLSVIEETLSGMRIIKAFTAEKSVQQNFGDKNNAYAKAQISLHRRHYLASPLSEFLSWAIIGFVLWYGGSLVLGEDPSVAPDMFIGYLVFFSQIIAPAKKITTANYNLKKGMASLNRIHEVLDAQNPIQQVEQPVAVHEFNEKIVYKDVWFKYQDKWVLQKINLDIEKGKTIALVGQSGSGKSTMVDMLPRFYDVVEGEISFDGHNLKNLVIPDLRNLFGIVNQEPILFNDTIFNNIAFGLENAKEEEVVAAAKIANAHDFIMETPENYQTNIGDRGSRLSGGQRQRISIARALLHNPPILILDEATSSLDTLSERLVQDALDNLIKNRTSIVIAHRLSTIHNADLICVMHEGEIVERGTHSELMAVENGYYYNLYKMQAFK